MLTLLTYLLFLLSLQLHGFQGNLYINLLHISASLSLGHPPTCLNLQFPVHRRFNKGYLEEKHVFLLSTSLTQCWSGSNNSQNVQDNPAFSLCLPHNNLIRDNAKSYFCKRLTEQWCVEIMNLLTALSNVNIMHTLIIPFYIFMMHATWWILIKSNILCSTNGLWVLMHKLDETGWEVNAKSHH